MRTPWGIADHVEDVGEGIKCVSTPSHGGYYVPLSLLARIPAAHQEYAERWSGSRQWYEEDCAWAAVALAFPQYFPADALELARGIAARWLDRAAVSLEPSSFAWADGCSHD